MTYNHIKVIDNSNLPPRTDGTPDNTRGFVFLNNYSAKSVPKENVQYRVPVIVKASRWYVEYYYRVPEKQRHLYNNAKWKRFRVFEDINRHKSDEYANMLRDAVEYNLRIGFDPFDHNNRKMELQAPQAGTINEAINLFKTKWANKGLETASIIKYYRTADRLTKYLTDRKLQQAEPDEIGKGFIERYLDELDLSNRSYNNELSFLSTMFKFLVESQIMTRNPCAGVAKKKVKVSKHRYYDERLFPKLREVLTEHDPYLLFACQCVYYLCIRSEKELKNMRVGNIFTDRKQVLLKEGKTGERYIGIPDELLQIFKERGILEADPSYYVFSVQNKNKFIADGKPGPEPFGNGFFSKRFSKLRKKIGVDNDYTIYGLKHSRIIHLKIDGVPDQDIMALTGHKDYHAFSLYLRDLGLTVNPETINAKTRKF